MSSSPGVDSVGTVSSSLLTYASVQALQPDLIINAGTAGGFKVRLFCFPPNVLVFLHLFLSSFVFHTYITLWLFMRQSKSGLYLYLKHVFYSEICASQSVYSNLCFHVCACLHGSLDRYSCLNIWFIRQRVHALVTFSLYLKLPSMIGEYRSL